MRARTRKRVKITRVYARACVYTHIHIYIYTYTRALVLAWFQGAEDRPPLVRESAALFFFLQHPRLFSPGSNPDQGWRRTLLKRCALSVVYHGRRAKEAEDEEAAGGTNAGRDEDVVCKGAALTRLFIAPHMAVACGS